MNSLARRGVEGVVDEGVSALGVDRREADHVDVVRPNGRVEDRVRRLDLVGRVGALAELVQLTLADVGTDERATIGEAREGASVVAVDTAASVDAVQHLEGSKSGAGVVEDDLRQQHIKVKWFCKE